MRIIPKRKRPGVAPQPMLVGTISLVNEGSRFVLIDNGDLPAPESGSVMKSYGDGAETGELMATQVRRRPFIIADIKGGAPQKGDRVLLPANAVRKATAAGEPERRRGWRLWPFGKKAE